MAAPWKLPLLLLLCNACYFLGPLRANALAKFTNIQCASLDSNFTVFTLCRLYAVKRDVVEMSVEANILHMPKEAITMRWQLLKRASGYKPFLYDISLPDACEYLEKRNHPFVNIIFSSLGNRTNIKKCPLHSQLSLKHFRFPVKALELLPLPSDEYAIYATFGFGGRDRCKIKTFFSITDFR